VYSRTQAERGAAAYAEACSSCHASDLRGSGNAPSLVGASFLFLWEDRTLAELLGVMRTEMPTNAPNSLPEPTYLDILAHLLEANGFPSGERVSAIRITGRDAGDTR
jgi:mono/diheme cytochrome c family protein